MRRIASTVFSDECCARSRKLAENTGQKGLAAEPNRKIVVFVATAD